MPDAVQSYIEDLRKHFELCSESPSGIRWKVNKGRAKVGDEAGSIKAEGYYSVKLNQKDIKAHHVVAALAEITGWQLVFEACHNKTFAYCIDHINGNKGANLPANLRVVTYRQNAINTACHRNGHLPGTTYRRGRAKPWHASYRHDGKHIHVGYFPSQKDAHLAYAAAIKAAQPKARAA